MSCAPLGQGYECIFLKFYISQAGVNSHHTKRIKIWNQKVLFSWKEVHSRVIFIEKCSCGSNRHVPRCFTSHAIFKTLFVFWFRLFFIGEGTFWPPSFLRVPPLGKKIYICQIVDFDSSKEASWCTACNGKKKSQLLAKYGFRKNKKIKLQKLPFMAILAKSSIFLCFSWFFQKWYFAKHCGFLRCIQCIRTLLLSYQNTKLDNFFRFSSKGGTLMI